METIVKNYKGLKVSVEAISVTNEDVFARIDELLEDRNSPELTDELVEEITGGSLHTVDEFVGVVGQQMVEIAKQDTFEKIIGALLEELAKNTETEITEAEMEEEKERSVNGFSDSLKIQGIDFEEYLTFFGKTIDDLKKEVEETVKSQLISKHALLKIAELEGLTAENDEELIERATQFVLDNAQIDVK